MNKIDEVFSKPGSRALIGYVTAGYPDLDTTVKLVRLLALEGCDIIELGIPFSDPVGDGPVIQQASFRALQNGTTVEKCLSMAGYLSSEVSVPLIFMTYFNPVWNFGIKSFVERAASAGVSGMIVPDLPVEESPQLRDPCKASSLDLIYMLSPASSEKRITLTAENASGFIYLMSVTGVTGTRSQIPAGLERVIAGIRRYSNVPVCIGFGISNAAQASSVSRLADGVIVGSRLIQLTEEDPTLEKAGCFIRELKGALADE
ncbi:MAG: tryptophan synthase subunit alpha [Dehalococcoidaceae bacterium]|nr:tryptophan synthase subunit alpha [Dehalococcoidaceae bacterium]